MPRDLRRYTIQTNLRLLTGFVLLLYLVGLGLIYFFYEWEAAITGLICLTLGLMPTLLIWLLLTFLGRIVSKADRG